MALKKKLDTDKEKRMTRLFGATVNNIEQTVDSLIAETDNEIIDIKENGDNIV